VSIAIDPQRLRRDLARRALSASELAREARLSGATVSAALAGRPVAASSLRLMADALLRVPVVAAIDALLPVEEGERGLG
jgi:transcriptional regulator with XRE-family HTH domain